MLTPEVSSAAYALIAAGFRVFVSPSHDNSIVVACYHDGKWHLGSLEYYHKEWRYLTKHVGDLQIGSGLCTTNRPRNLMSKFSVKLVCLMLHFGLIRNWQNLSRSMILTSGSRSMGIILNISWTMLFRIN